MPFIKQLLCRCCISSHAFLPPSGFTSTLWLLFVLLMIAFQCVLLCCDSCLAIWMGCSSTSKWCWTGSAREAVSSSNPLLMLLVLLRVLLSVL